MTDDTAVVIVTRHGSRSGGAEAYLEQFIDFAEQAKVRPVLISLSHGDLVESAKSRGVPSLVVNPGRLRHLHRALRTAWVIAETARSERARVIIGWEAKAQLYVGPASLLSGIPSLWVQHGVNASRPTRTDRLATILPAKLIITNSSVTSAAQQHLRPRRSLRPIPPGVDLSRFAPRDASTIMATRERLGLPVHGPVVGSVGRLIRAKGFHLLLEAAPEIISRHPDASFVVVGGDVALDAEHGEQLRQQAEALGLGDRIRLVGHQPHPEDWLSVMDVFCHTSDYESFGMTLIEAMALAKPVITWSTGTPAEIVRHDVDGVRIPYGDVPALIEAIDGLLSRPEWRERLGHAAHVRSLDFSAVAMAERLGAVIAEVAGLKVANAAG